MSDGETVRTPDPDERGAGDPLWARAGELFDAWRAGRSDAMDALVRLLTPVLWHVVRAYGLDRAEAQDVMQTTWLALVRNRDAVRDPRTLVAWLTTTARREAWRVVKSEARSSPADDEQLERIGGRADAADTVAERELERERLWGAVAALSERCRRLVRVIAFAERPDYGRLSAELQMPVGSIGPTRGRCLEKLRMLLADGEVA